MTETASRPGDGRHTLTVVVPCFNEQDNVRPLVAAIRDAMAPHEDIDVSFLFIDNASVDDTARVLREMASEDPTIGVILNTRNFGHVRSPYHGVLQAEGDAVVVMAADFQDPPALIPRFVDAWKSGATMVVGVKETSDESVLWVSIRYLYYRLVGALADVSLIPDFTGFGLYDQRVIQTLRGLHDAYPYFRGLIADLGFDHQTVRYRKPPRRTGITKNNFYTLYDVAMLGITNHSKVPLRIATMAGFATSGLSMLVALFYLAYKLVWWDGFDVGVAPVVIGLFFFGSVQLFFIGMLGEYIGAIHTQVQNRPLVVERERLNLPPLSRAAPENGPQDATATPR